MIIGLSGYAQAGKDTVARHLVEKHGFRQIAFADALRSMAETLNPIVDWDPMLDVPLRYTEAIATRGYEEAKRLPEVRRFLQVLGTDAGRQILGDNVWVDLAWRGVQLGEDVVFSDMRFPNEAESVLDADGALWRLRRPGHSAINAHASETALDGWHFDAVLENDRTLEDLYARVDQLLVTA